MMNPSVIFLVVFGVAFGLASAVIYGFHKKFQEMGLSEYGALGKIEELLVFRFQYGLYGFIVIWILFELFRTNVL